MSLTPRLSRKLHDTLGSDAAEDLVSWMQERESYHGDLRAETQLGFAKLDARLGELRETMRADIAELRQQMEARSAELRLEMGLDRESSRVAMTDLRREIAQRSSDLIKWSFLFWVGAVGAIAALAGVLR